jgi:HAD superfamily hydrolase (TIGR01509 family)
MSWTLAIFDFDGTLADLPVDWQGLKGALARRFRDLYDCDVEFDRLNEGLRHVKKRLGRRGLLEAYRMIEQFEGRAIKLMRPRESPLETLRRVHARGGTSAVCSNNMSVTVKASLELLGVSDKVAIVVGRDSVSRPKPHPEGLRQILIRMNVDGREAVLVGDSPDDAEAARRAGVSFVTAEQHRILRESTPSGDTAQAAGVGFDRVQTTSNRSHTCG